MDVSTLVRETGVSVDTLRASPDSPPMARIASPLPSSPSRAVCRLLALPVALVLTGCGHDTTLTIRNDTLHPVIVDGLPGFDRRIEPGLEHREEHVDAALSLVAKQVGGPFEERAEIELPPRGGASFWSIGGGTCVVEADFTSYYDRKKGERPGIGIPGMKGPKDHVYVSKHAIATIPGQTLPEDLRGDGVYALIEVKCAATVSEDAAATWLDLMLPQLLHPSLKAEGGSK
jgi:hypothetical protein